MTHKKKLREYQSKMLSPVEEAYLETIKGVRGVVEGKVGDNKK